MQIVTLTTDFGLKDAYVAAMKGVILSLAPETTLVDISHQVAAQNVLEGALLLEGVVPFFPANTIHLVVIDPGVGTARRPIAARTHRGLFVAPDNGVLTLFLTEPGLRTIVHLNRSQYFRHSVSATFHGRDIFAPAAGQLARGTPLEDLGDTIDDPVLLEIPQARQADTDTWLAEVVHVDRFGNLVTSLRAAELDGKPQAWTFEIGGKRLKGLHRAYGQVREGEFLALTGSTGRVEIAQRNGHAARALGLKPGAPVVARRTP